MLRLVHCTRLSLLCRILLNGLEGRCTTTLLVLWMSLDGSLLVERRVYAIRSRVHHRPSCIELLLLLLLLRLLLMLLHGRSKGALARLLLLLHSRSEGALAWLLLLHRADRVYRLLLLLHSVPKLHLLHLRIQRRLLGLRLLVRHVLHLLHLIIINTLIIHRRRFLRTHQRRIRLRILRPLLRISELLNLLNRLDDFLIIHTRLRLLLLLLHERIDDALVIRTRLRLDDALKLRRVHAVAPGAQPR